MDLFDISGQVEEKLSILCQSRRIPMGGTMELLPLCNMNCSMCYIRQDPAEMARIGRMLSLEEWLRIAEEAKRCGVVSLLLTGGEPLLYPKFRELYTALTDMGFVITINTNGTLINEDMAAFLAARPCRRLNITLYGKDDETYGRLCQNPHGFTQVMHAVDLLNAANIPFRFNCTMTPENIDQLEDLVAIADDKKAPIVVTSHVFAPIRRENPDFRRITPEESAEVSIRQYCLLHPGFDFGLVARHTLKQMDDPNRSCISEGLGCRAGLCGFWITWNGDLLPCGMFEEPRISLLEHDFSGAWEYIVEETKKLQIYEGCFTCERRNICNVCAAGCLTENGGDMTKKPDYICKRTEAYERLLRELAEK